MTPRNPLDGKVIIRKSHLAALCAMTNPLYQAQSDTVTKAMRLLDESLWRPITTFPNKSGIYLVCDQRTKDIWVAAYNDGQGKNKNSWGDDRKTGWVGYTYGADATHWMPLPPPPQEGEW